MNSSANTVIFLISYAVSDEKIKFFIDNFGINKKIILVNLQNLPLINLKKNPRNKIKFSKQYKLYEPTSYFQAYKVVSNYKKSILIKFYQDDVYDILIRIITYRKVIITWNTFSSYLSLERKINSLNLKKIFFMFFYYLIRIIDITISKNILFTNRKVNTVGYSKIIRINNEIYDEYIQNKDKYLYNHEGKKFIGIILGNNIFQKYDHYKVGDNLIDFSDHYIELKKVLELLSKDNLVKIYLHPNTKENVAKNLLGNYTYENEVNFYKLENCKLILGYSSTALIYPLLLNIPVGIITSNTFQGFAWLQNSINWYISIFGVNEINISHEITYNEILSKSIVNNVARNLYITNHLKSENNNTNLIIVENTIIDLFK